MALNGSGAVSGSCGKPYFWCVGFHCFLQKKKKLKGSEVVTCDPPRTCGSFRVFAFLVSLKLAAGQYRCRRFIWCSFVAWTGPGSNLNSCFVSGYQWFSKRDYSYTELFIHQKNVISMQTLIYLPCGPDTEYRVDLHRWICWSVSLKMDHGENNGRSFTCSKRITVYRSLFYSHLKSIYPQNSTHQKKKESDWGDFTLNT